MALCGRAPWCGEAKNRATMSDIIGRYSNLVWHHKESDLSRPLVPIPAFHPGAFVNASALRRIYNRN